MKRSDLGRQAARDRAMVRPELRGMVPYFNAADQLPHENRTCSAWAQQPEDPQPYRLPFPVVYRGGQWINERHGNLLEVRIVAWNYA